MVGSKLHHTPRYRQKVRFVPFGISEPVWVDDRYFDLSYHLRHTAVPAPGSESQLRGMAARVFSQHLDRARPLWEIWMVEGLSEGRWALLSKVHHCMVDGVAATDLMSVMFDDDAATPPRTAITGHRRRSPAASSSSCGVLAGRMRGSRIPGAPGGGGLAAGARRGGQHRPRTRRCGPGDAACHFLADRTDRASPDMELGHRRARRRQADASGAGRHGQRHRAHRDHERLSRRSWTSAGRRSAPERVVRTMVPVSVRRPDERGVYNNRVSAVFARLPVGLDDPEARLAGIRAQMDGIKASKQAVAGDVLAQLSGFAPPLLLALGSRVMTRSARLNMDTATTNVPGPQSPVRALGRRLLESYPYVPIVGTIRIVVAIFSYDGTLYFGVTGDRDHAPDVDVLTTGIEAGAAALGAYAQPPVSPPVIRGRPRRAATDSTGAPEPSQP